MYMQTTVYLETTTNTKIPITAAQMYTGIRFTEFSLTDTSILFKSFPQKSVLFHSPLPDPLPEMVSLEPKGAGTGPVI